ncbi:shikimate dehydrogenase [Austwickia chelonae]|uniref:Shikimate dehydrogenase n=1 Tax=Austwickia chelonae NBRC 105200 TaxID=1184607 RepID=K6UM10_9MICO|nr:shikimate dehydrogenase [Austwickia chelonae]GAB77706.1 shikimate dehydrogenase [Austwickia chelonae NBRC 105200]SEW16210.1 shikimate dehydrogenase [Austwickia chelonae]
MLTDPPADTSSDEELCRAAVLGSPIAHSLSPVLHRAAYRALGLSRWTYERRQVGGPDDPSLAEFLSGLGPQWRGLSVTMPVKETALACADEVTPVAELVGAANTLIRSREGWRAANTDVHGLVRTLGESGIATPRRALILGAGATARAACVALAELGVSGVDFAVRRQVREGTSTVADRAGLDTGVRAIDELASYAGEYTLIISTLPTGVGIELPADGTGSPGPGGLLVDVVYGGWPTPLARWASAGGARVLSGREMLLHQAAAQVQLMTGREAPLSQMRAALAAV